MRIPATTMMLSMLMLLILCIQDIAALPAEASDNLWKHMTIQVCNVANFKGACRYFDVMVDECRDISSDYSREISSFRAVTHMGCCQLYRTPRCEALFGDTDMAVRWGEGGKSTLSGWTKRDIKSMKCFILGRPTEMIDYY
ncbi:hypothetical protein J4E86_011739 [Alternaria arbusti]|uniref:uncharacterized protein n=1 Tax=Alternaria arbusti TaxID=232088 RepID=UPI00221E5FC0|nr:uncharacterized protein J4E86_011739 [Alternaria arbusti]KAI4929211.1 hypothetical protein J4E86_011739 [Alternaria arbusti]